MNWYRKIASSVLPVMNVRKFTKKLKSMGITFERASGGSHTQWSNPAKNLSTTIPIKSLGSTINPYLASEILKQLGISLQEYNAGKLNPIEQNESSLPEENIPEWQKQPWYQQQQQMATV